jgi:hypothetical protein
MDLLERYLERVAIMQTDAGIPFATARFQAYQELRRIHGYANVPRTVHEMAKNEHDERWKNWKQ